MTTLPIRVSGATRAAAALPALALLFPAVLLPHAYGAEDMLPVDALVIPYRQVSVSFPVGGIIEELTVREGTIVQRGDLLGALEHQEELLDSLRFEKILEKRTSDHAATSQLFGEGVISEDEALEKRIEKEIADIQLRRAQATLDRRMLRSPLTGLVVARMREPGEWVDPGTVVLEIIDVERVYAQLMLDAHQSASIELGQDVPLLFPSILGQERVIGSIDFIDPRIDASSGLLRVRVLIENPGGRLPTGLSGIAYLPR